MVEVQKLKTSYDFCKPRATLRGDSRGRGSKTEISASRARPSAEIRVVEVQKLGTFYDFCKPRATSAKIVRVEALSLRRRANLLLAKWPLEVVLWLARLLSQSRGRGFDSPLVRGSSGLKIAAFKYKRSTRSVLRACSKSQLLSTKIVREVHSHSSGSTCAEQVAQSHFRRATCSEQTCAKQRFSEPSCAEPLT